MTPATYTRCLSLLMLDYQRLQEAIAFTKGINPSNAAIGELLREYEATQMAIEDLQTQELAR